MAILLIQDQILAFLHLGQDVFSEKVQGKDQDKTRSKKDSHSENREKKLNLQSGTYTMKTYRKPNEQLFSQ